ncbi:LysR family transcriptional regulator [Loigolactobacillus backii]|uniref:LysR family transcriptional regulator n=1 Tax=Loigolactobacillus backii TaxID=375175 RepID=UPI0007F092A8|nr:LysR family transcriptional regulator [Loigolactobacillus backii]ANK59492.1 LysR family transcriptional regulator [Loigolactobacillus backii]ANK64485.1 LysR family transcriptional regulator [Loigolactobacillus backii]ANK67119.1 LysR family transcriptional regulator [Loigolactobacillus backii]
MKTKQENIFSSKTLTYFLQLAETMNYTQAAQLLGITQPALTQQIKKLERTVDAPLFYSVGKKLHLSDAGRTMLKTTHEIYDLLNQATDEIQQTTSATQGKISIGLLASIEDRVLEDFAIKYYKQNPKIELSFHMLTRKEIWERLENNQIDLAVMYLPDDSIKNWKPYQSKKIISEDLLFLHHNEKLAKRKKIKYKDTIDNDWVTYPGQYYLNSFIKEAYKNQLVDAPKSVAHFTTPNQIMRFSNATGLYTALPNSYVQANAATANLWSAPFDPAIRFDLAFVFRKEKNQIPRIANFLSGFDQYIATEDYISRLKSITE